MRPNELKRDKNYIRYIVEFEDCTFGFMVVSHWHVRDRGDYIARTLARERQEEGLLPNKPIARVRRALSDE